jgi:uncharacterized protein YndB with AHSA1/START domain
MRSRRSRTPPGPRRGDGEDDGRSQPLGCRAALAGEAAFDLFTARLGDWWPKDSHHLSEGRVADVFLEPRVGGRWYERAEDGSECDWGHVREIEPPERILLAWQLTPEWKYDPDPARARRSRSASVQRTMEPA